MDANRFLIIGKNDINGDNFNAPYRSVILPPCKGFWLRQIVATISGTDLYMIAIRGLSNNPICIINDCNTAMVDIYVKTTDFLSGAVIFPNSLNVQFYDLDGTAQAMGANDHFACLVEFDY